MFKFTSWLLKFFNKKGPQVGKDWVCGTGLSKYK